MSGKGKAQLLLVYNAVKEQHSLDDMRWTYRRERELRLVTAREVGSVHSSSVMRDAVAVKTEYFSTKLSTLPSRQLFKVMGAVLQDLEDPDLVEDFLQNWRSHAEDTFDVVAEDSDSESYLDKSWIAEDDEEPGDGEEPVDDEDSFGSSDTSSDDKDQSDDDDEESSDTSSDDDDREEPAVTVPNGRGQRAQRGSSDTSSDDDDREEPAVAVPNSRAQRAQRRARYV